MQELRQSTQVLVVIGPAVAVGDGFTPVTTLDLSTADEAEILKHNTSTVTSISGATFAAITSADGYYVLTITTSLSDTLGMLTVVINDDSLILPIRQQFMVLSPLAWDAKYTAAGSTGLGAGASVYGTMQAGSTSTTAVLASGTSFANDLINGATLVITGGTGVGQSRVITDWVSSSDTATVDTWTTTPDNTSTYAVYPTPPVPATTATNITGNITGNLSGSVGSVSGAVGSVTGNVGGNVTGSVGSVVGAVGSVTGNVGGNVTGSVGSVVGAVGSVTGAVGSVTGNVGGNVVGSVGSVVGDIGGLAAGAITDVSTGVAASLAASGINPTDGVGRISAVNLAVGGAAPSSPIGEAP